jgi:hypothetical protein
MAMHVGAGRGPGHLNRRLQGSSGPPAPVTGDAVALAIRDATAINFVDGNGWTADITFKGLTTGGTLNLAAGPLAISLDRLGYDGSGAVAHYAETINGAAALREPAPNQAQFTQLASGSDVVVTATLDRYVLASDTITSATIAAGAYNGGGASNASTIGTLLNSSTFASPIPLYGFLTPPAQAPTGANFHVEFLAYHFFARFGRQVACVEFRVRDVATSTDQGISVKVNDPSLSTLLTQGPKVEVYAADIPMTSLSQGVQYDVYARIYRWIGNSVFDTTTAGDLPLTTARACQAGLRFMCDKGGTYGDLVAYVKNGGSGTPALNSITNPYATISAAAMALRAANNAKALPDKRNDVGGSRIRLMEDSLGAGATIAGFGGTLGNDMDTAAPATTKVWYTLEADPAATGLIKLVTSSTKFPGRMLHLKLGAHFTIERAVVLGTTNDDIIIDGGGFVDIMAWVEGANLAFGYTPTNTWIYRYFNGMLFLTNNTFGAGSTPFAANMPIFAANLITGTQNGNALRPQIVVGNRCDFSINLTDDGGVSDNCDRGMICNNVFLKNTDAVRLPGALYGGYAHCNNVYEVMAPLNGNIMGADGSTLNFPNFVEWHNSVFGDRMNRMYTASGIATGGLVKWGNAGFSITYRWNCKSDYFRVNSDGGPNGNDRTGNWPYRFGVEQKGLIVINGDSTGGTAYGPAGWLQEIQPRLSRPTATVGVTSNASANGTGVGGGDYHLTGGSNDAYGVVPAGEAVFKYDLDGNPRLNNGSGAAGAYERP